MAVTQTRQGITTRQLLCTLPSSNSIIGIPRQILDPRRPVNRDPSSTEAEEGLFKYNPFLEFDGRWFLTHSRDVAGINNVLVKDTLLESTGLVIAFGGDVYGTRVMPSQAFDVLGKGFSKIQLVLTVVALGIGVTVLAPIVSLFLSSLLLDGMLTLTCTGAEKANQYDLEDWFLGVDVQVFYASCYDSECVMLDYIAP